MDTTYTNSTDEQLDPWFQCFSSLSVMITHNLNFLVGLPLNIYIILLIRAGGLDGSGIFILNQALNDIFFTLPAPLYLLCYCESPCFLQPLRFFTAFCLISRFMFQCCVSLERYLAVVHPVVFRKYRDLKYRLASSMVIWIYSLIISVFYLFYFDKAQYYIFGLLQTGIFTVIIFCCVSIWRVLRRPGPGIREREDGEVSAVKKRAFATVFINLLTFLMQMIPLTVAFCACKMLPASSFALALIISFHVYIAAGFVQTVFFLYQFGKLTPMCRG